MMKTRTMRPVWIATAVALLPLTGGCGTARELRQMKQDIATQLPDVAFDHEVSFALGPGGLALAKAAISFVPDAEEARAWLKDVSRVEVAVYDVKGNQTPGQIDTPARVQKMIDGGWELAARVRDQDEAAWILYRIDGESIRELFVVALDREELVMVKAKGRLERVIARALTDGNGRSHFRKLHRGT